MYAGLRLLGSARDQAPERCHEVVRQALHGLPLVPLAAERPARLEAPVAHDGEDLEAVGAPVRGAVPGPAGSSAKREELRAG